VCVCVCVCVYIYIYIHRKIIQFSLMKRSMLPSLFIKGNNKYREICDIKMYALVVIYCFWDVTSLV
jgi:hypothetical protein